MKFTKGLIVGAALGMSAAMMMNNKMKTADQHNRSTDSTTTTQVQPDDYVINDIM